ncbi:peroxiredoxin family protein [Flavisphingomonas formosensis]|uniref:peroxiredoxin family protein n=1 Tax=Flavisphingomonas formosensis TaxID=861534 RepID=UPI0012FAB06C|nr:TlpA disulfide reductase family protein [Sphingomonas formosensis]
MMRTLALVPLLGLLLLAACGKPAGTASPAGPYRAVISLPSGELPFGLEVTEKNGVPVATIVNGDNRVQAEQTRFQNGRLTLDFPSYDSSLDAELKPDGTLAGTAHLYRRSGRVDAPLSAMPGIAWRFFERQDPPAAKLSGRWLIETQGEKPEKGLLLLDQNGNRLTGTVQFPSGDERFLTGEVSGAQFALSTFDGNQGSVWKGNIRRDGSLSGDSYGATSKVPEAWTAKRQDASPADQVAAIAEEKPPVDRIAFTFPDVDGKPVSLADPRFKGKVVIVSIGGTWCPNCHDEIAYLAPYVDRRRAEGLEAIGLQFEYDADPVRSARQIKRFAERYRVHYPLLIAGEATPEGTKKALPAIGGVRVYPTTLFIDRRGRLRAIHVGYAGPAAGALHEQAIQRFDTLVNALLAEKA